MGYESWENIGYKVIDKINSFDVILKDIREDIKEIKKEQSTIQIKMWIIGVVATSSVSVLLKIFSID